MTGVRFECQPGCTNCCEQQGFVYLTEDDLDRIAEYVGMTAREFERRYVYRTKHLLRLRVPRAPAVPLFARRRLLDSCGEAGAMPRCFRSGRSWWMEEAKREWKKTAAMVSGNREGRVGAD